MSDYENAPELTPDTQLLIPNWNRFQHYKDRRPTWIKLYTDVLDNPQFLGLSMASRGLLMTIWVTYASNSCHICAKDVSRFCHRSASYYQLIELNQAGFLEFAASTSLAKSLPRIRERERKDLALAKNEKTAQRELLSRALDLAADWQGGSSESFDDLLDALERELHAELPQSQRYKLWDEALKRQRPQP